MKYILICEDEKAIREFVSIHLRRCGYHVLEAATGEEAVSLYKQHAQEIVLAILDVMLPQMNGLQVCEWLRSQSDAMGIIMLTALSREEEKIQALKLGADDYVTKPFGPSELMARVEALERRVLRMETDHSVLPEELISGDFVLNLRHRTLKRMDTLIELTQIEFQIMQYFLEHPGQPLSRLQILKQVWGDENYGDEKIVDVNIRRLRMKIEQNASEPQHLQTVWGKGYCWK